MMYTHACWTVRSTGRAAVPPRCALATYRTATSFSRTYSSESTSKSPAAKASASARSPPVALTFRLNRSRILSINSPDTSLHGRGRTGICCNCRGKPATTVRTVRGTTAGRARADGENPPRIGLPRPAGERPEGKHIEALVRHCFDRKLSRAAMMRRIAYVREWRFRRLRGMALDRGIVRRERPVRGPVAGRTRISAGGAGGRCTATSAIPPRPAADRAAAISRLGRLQLRPCVPRRDPAIQVTRAVRRVGPSGELVDGVRAFLRALDAAVLAALRAEEVAIEPLAGRHRVVTSRQRGSERTWRTARLSGQARMAG